MYLITLLIINITQILSDHQQVSNCKAEVYCEASKKLMISIPKLSGSPAVDQLWAILFENKLIIAEEDSNAANTETNIDKFVVNQFLLNELILDCANGLFPCSPIEYAMLHTGNLAVTKTDEEKVAIAKEQFDGVIQDGFWDSIKDLTCVVMNQVDESDLEGQKKIIVMCDRVDAIGELGVLLQGLSPAVFKYNLHFKSMNNGVQNTLPLRATRAKGFDVSNKIYLGHLIVYKNRITLYGNVDESGLKEKLYEAYQTHMLPLRKTAEAFTFNTKDGHCINILRENAEPFNLCFETKKLRDIMITTIYNNQSMYKIFENLMLIQDANMACGDSMIQMTLKSLWNLNQMQVQLPALKNNIEQSAKFVFEHLQEAFKPFVVEGDAQTEQTNKIGVLYETTCAAELEGYQQPFTILTSFLQKKMSVHKSTSYIQNKSQISSKVSIKSKHKASIKNKSHAKTHSKSKSKTKGEEGGELDKESPDYPLMKWEKELAEDYTKRDFIPLPDVRIENFDRTKCKEGQDTFQCMSEFLASKYNRLKCNKRLLIAQYAKKLYEDELSKMEDPLVPAC